MTVAFIPVRGGSKSIPLKNIKPIAGKPLVYWTVKAAVECKAIEQVFVSTDNEAIRSTVESFGFDKVAVVDRSPETAEDTSSTESAMLEFARAHEFDTIVLIQATSPQLRASDLEGGMDLYRSSVCDSVLSVVRQYRFLWKKAEDGTSVVAENYDIYHRPRRQDFEGYLMENGAFYITSRAALLQTQNRISGRIMAYEMPENTAVEIDEPDDWIIVERMMRIKQDQTVKAPIKVLLTDCDGCLTDGGMYYSEYGDELKKFNTRDGVAFAMLREQGIKTGIITSENVALNRRRAEKLKLDFLETACKDKTAAIYRICEKMNISPENVAYIGDDLNDMDAIKMAGFSCCPADAVQEVKECVDYVTKAKGGEGVVREVVELVINEKLNPSAVPGE